MGEVYCRARPHAPQNLDYPRLPPYTSARSLQGQRICDPRGAPNGGRKSMGEWKGFLTCLAAAN